MNFLTAQVEITTNQQAAKADLNEVKSHFTKTTQDMEASLSKMSGKSVDSFNKIASAAKLVFRGAIVGFITNALENITSNMLEARNKGENMFLALALGIPIVGKLAKTFENLGELLTGTKQKMADLAKYQAFLNDIAQVTMTTERQRALLKFKDDQDTLDRLVEEYRYQDELLKLTKKKDDLLADSSRNKQYDAAELLKIEQAALQQQKLHLEQLDRLETDSLDRRIEQGKKKIEQINKEKEDQEKANQKNNSTLSETDKLLAGMVDKSDRLRRNFEELADASNSFWKGISLAADKMK